MSLRLASLLDLAESAFNAASKIEALQKFHAALLGERTVQFVAEENLSSSLSAIFPRVLRLQCDENTMVRCLVSEILVDVSSKYLEFTPIIAPVLISALNDETPVVARQAIRFGLRLLKHILAKISIQGHYSSELNDLLISSWDSMLEFKDSLYPLAFQKRSGGVNLLALKCMEEIIHLFTPDMSGKSEPPLEEGDRLEFNMSWIRGDHQILNAADLSIEASKILSMLLDQLRPPKIHSLSNLIIIVITKSLATIAKTRPSFYGRILPVLLGLDASNSKIKGVHAYGARLALKNAFITCLNCTHPSSEPWRDRLTQALKDFKLGLLTDDYIYPERNILPIKEEVLGQSMDSEAEKPMSSSGDHKKHIVGRKRIGLEDDAMSNEVDSMPSKRSRSRSVSSSDDAAKGQGVSSAVIKDEIVASDDSSNSDESKPIQQLVAMFGTLVAQGDKAIGSLEILISSISVDLLAEVVMANMCHLQSFPPNFDSDDELLVSMTITGSDNKAKYPQSFLANVLSLSSSFPAVARQLLARNVSPFEDQHQLLDVSDKIQRPPVDVPPYTSANKVDVDVSGLSPSADTENLDSDIPGIVASACNEASSEIARNSASLFNEMEQFASISFKSSLDSLPFISVEVSGNHNPKDVITKTSSLLPSLGTSINSSSAVILPKISAPVLTLDDVQKDQLQILAFVRIIDAYKYIALAGGSQIRFSLLACLGVEFPTDIDPWKLLQTHIISDYVVFEGHELTLRLLFRLFREIEEDRDLFSTTTAATAYETFLLDVVEALKLSFPPSDKSLSKLLCEAPYLPKPVLSFLESLCCPENIEQSDDSKIGDRVTQGLSTVWNLVMLRPPLREPCLKIALKSASHHSEEVRMKAIRLVANKLFPFVSLSRQIEDFARDSLLTVASADANADTVTNNQENVTSGSSTNKEDGSRQSAEIESSVAILDAQRCTSLYFALCTKKHKLLLDIFLVYKSASNALKEAVHIHIPILIRTIGSAPQLLEILSDPPLGSEDLVIQVVKALTEAAVPSPELIGTIVKLYDTKMMLPDILILILPFLSREEIFLKFSKLVILPPEKFQKAVAQILQGSAHSGPVLAPAEVLIALHGVDPERDGIPLKKVTEACNSCFEQPQIFTQQVLAMALNQLVEQIPLPLLFMRTVLQAMGAYPALVDFVMEILSRLVAKQIWKYPKLWVGFLRCVSLTKPRSFPVLLQLPPPQLENALNKNPDLKPLLATHASQPHIKSSLPRSVMAVVGISPEKTESSVVPEV